VIDDKVRVLIIFNYFLIIRTGGLRLWQKSDFAYFL